MERLCWRELGSGDAVSCEDRYILLLFADYEEYYYCLYPLDKRACHSPGINMKKINIEEKYQQV